MCFSLLWVCLREAGSIQEDVFYIFWAQQGAIWCSHRCGGCFREQCCWWSRMLSFRWRLPSLSHSKACGCVMLQQLLQPTVMYELLAMIFQLNLNHFITTDTQVIRCCYPPVHFHTKTNLTLLRVTIHFTRACIALFPYTVTNRFTVLVVTSPPFCSPSIGASI